MNKFTFALEKVLSYNISTYEKERNELSKLRMELNDMEESLRSLQLTLETKSRTFKERMANSGVFVDDIRQQQFLEDTLKHEIEDAKKAILSKQAEVDLQLLKVIEADKDVKKLEKLKEKQLDDYNKAVAKETQEEILEGVTRKLYN